jgi:hypothetical protein
MTEYELTSKIESLYNTHFKDRPRFVEDEVKNVIADCLSYWKACNFDGSGVDWEYKQFIIAIEKFKNETGTLLWHGKSENVLLLLSIEKDMIPVVAKVSKGNLQHPSTILLFRLHNIIRRLKISIELSRLRQVTDRLDIKLSLDGVYPYRDLGSNNIKRFIGKILTLYKDHYSDRAQIIKKIQYCFENFIRIRKDTEAFANLSEIYDDMLSISEAQNGDPEKATNGDQDKSDTKVTMLLSKLRDQVTGDTSLTIILFELRNLIYRYEMDFALSAVEMTSRNYL